MRETQHVATISVTFPVCNSNHKYWSSLYKKEPDYFFIPVSVWLHWFKWEKYNMLPPYLSRSLYTTATINTDLHYTKRNQSIFFFPVSVWLHWFKWEKYNMLPPYLSCSLYTTATINTDLHYTKRSQTIFSFQSLFGYIDLNERNTICCHHICHVPSMQQQP